VSISTLASARVRTPGIGLRSGASFGMFGSVATSATYVATAVKQLVADPRNDAQGGLSAWSPPV
jgi:hypothetical protein